MGFHLEFIVGKLVTRYEVKYLLSLSVTAVESQLRIDGTKIKHNNYKYIVHKLVFRISNF